MSVVLDEEEKKRLQTLLELEGATFLGAHAVQWSVMDEDTMQNEEEKKRREHEGVAPLNMVTELRFACKTSKKKCRVIRGVFNFKRSDLYEYANESTVEGLTLHGGKAPFFSFRLVPFGTKVKTVFSNWGTVENPKYKPLEVVFERKILIHPISLFEIVN